MPPSAPYSRLFAALWFGGIACLAVSAFFAPLKLAGHGALLFIALPTLAGAIAGFALGAKILERTQGAGYGDALLRGVGVALAAFVIFAALFALALPLTERGWAFGESANLFVGTLIFGPLMGGPLALVAGAVAGVSLHWLARRRE